MSKINAGGLMWPYYNMNRPALRKDFFQKARKSCPAALCWAVAKNIKYASHRSLCAARSNFSSALSFLINRTKSSFLVTAILQLSHLWQIFAWEKASALHWQWEKSVLFITLCRRDIWLSCLFFPSRLDSALLHSSLRIGLLYFLHISQSKFSSRGGLRGFFFKIW